MKHYLLASFVTIATGSAALAEDTPLWPESTSPHYSTLDGLTMECVEAELREHFGAAVTTVDTRLRRVYYENLPDDPSDDEGYFHTGNILVNLNDGRNVFVQMRDRFLPDNLELRTLSLNGQATAYISYPHDFITVSGEESRLDSTREEILDIEGAIFKCMPAAGLV